MGFHQASDQSWGEVNLLATLELYIMLLARCFSYFLMHDARPLKQCILKTFKDLVFKSLIMQKISKYTQKHRLRMSVKARQSLVHTCLYLSNLKTIVFHHF